MDSLNSAAKCPLCGNANECPRCIAAPEAKKCWCASITIPDELLARVPPELVNKACICRSCVETALREAHKKEPFLAQEGEYYFEPGGLMVFTEAYHLRRGYCCGNGCRHCPYPNQRGG